MTISPEIKVVLYQCFSILATVIAILGAVRHKNLSREDSSPLLMVFFAVSSVACAFFTLKGFGAL